MTTRMIATTILMAASLALAGCGGDKALSYYNLGVEAAEREEYGEAARLWEQSLRHRPDDPATRYNLGVALVNLGRYEEAETQLREAVRLDPLDPQAHEMLGTACEKQGKLVEAKLAYQGSLNVRPTHVPALLGLASIALAENQNRSAEGYATEAVDLDPNNVDANRLLAEAYFRNGDNNAAYGQILTAKRLAPSDPAILFLSGKIAYARKMYADAVAALERSRALAQPNDELFLYLGLTRLALGDLAQAEKDLRLAVYRNEGNALAWKALAETYIRLKKWSEARDAVTRSLAIDPENPETVLDRALVAMGTGDLPAAAVDLESVFARSDAPAITPYYLGHVYLRLDRRADARQAFERFLAGWEGDPALAEEARAAIDRLSP